MPDCDSELAQLRARVAELEARPAAADMDWFKNSNVWKIAQFASSTGWIKFNVIGVAAIWGFFILAFVYAGLKTVYHF